MKGCSPINEGMVCHVLLPLTSTMCYTWGVEKMFECRKAGAVMELSSFLGFPSTLTVDTVERSAEGLIITLHATTSTVFCPICGTAGSRIHSRYTRTVSNLTVCGQRLILKLLVRKWVCPSDSCPQRIFAEPFVGVVRRYARMTDRLRSYWNGLCSSSFCQPGSARI